MVTRRRINLSLAERDFERVSEIARAEGKTPSTFVADMVKAALWNASRVPIRTRRKAQDALKASGDGVGAGDPEKRPLEPVSLSRQQRRAIERAKSKGGK